MALEDLAVKAEIERSKLPGAAKIELRDGKGLVLRIAPPSHKEPKGAAIWWQRYRSPEDGKQRETELGRYPALTPSKAREKAEGVRAVVSGGVDPRLQAQRDLATTNAAQQAEIAENTAKR